jgi:signal transduction histidine kinase
VQVTVEAGPAEVAIRVLDDGLGMPPELAAAPFEPARHPRTTATAPTNATATTSNATANATATTSNATANATATTSNATANVTATTSNATAASNGTSNGRASSRKSAGAGLGLSIAKGIVQAHGGRLELTPRPKGTCFSVYLPVEAEVLEAVRTAGPRAANHEASTDQQKDHGEPRDDSDD